MVRKYKFLLKISFISGLIPFLGGWTIFFIWLAGRHLIATDFIELEIAGFYWLIICFWVAIVGLLTLVIYAFINRKSLHMRVFVTLFIILLNIPSVLIILRMHAKQEKKVFIKLYNNTGLNNVEYTLIGKIKEVRIGTLNDKDSKVYHYEPPYSFLGERIYQEPDSLKLVISSNLVQDTIHFPTLPQGACRHLLVNKEFKLKSP